MKISSGDIFALFSIRSSPECSNGLSLIRLYKELTSYCTKVTICTVLQVIVTEFLTFQLVLVLSKAHVISEIDFFFLKKGKHEFNGLKHFKCILPKVSDNEYEIIFHKSSEMKTQL
jgi:hypothetical protein